MAGRKSSRSSKTDHVLSLLSGAGAGDSGQTAAGHGTTVEETAKLATSSAPGVEKTAEKAEQVSGDKKHTAAERGRKQGGTKPQARSEAGDAGHSHSPQSQQRRVAPPILEVARQNNEALSETIREALSDALDQELVQQSKDSSLPEAQASITQPDRKEESPSIAAHAPVSGEASRAAMQPEEMYSSQPVTEEVPLSDSVPEPEMSDGSQSQLKKGPVQERTPEPASVPEAAVPAAQEAEKERQLPDGSVFLNVMELLVEERIEKYVKMFGLCSCPRCMADVRALALTRLPAKYVVLPKSAQAPMMSMYQAKYDATVIAQVIQACKTVMENPRHQP